MRVAISAPLVHERATGPGVHLTQLVRAMLTERPALAVTMRHATARGFRANRESAARIDERVRPITTPLSATLLRHTQARFRFPPERALLGRFDVYHQFHTDADPAVSDQQLVVTIHDTVTSEWPEAEGRVYPFAGRLLNRAHAVITVSEFSKSAICSTFDVDPDRVHVIYNGVNHELFRPDDPSEAKRSMINIAGADRPYLVYVGGHTPRKNLPRIIEAYAAVRSSNPGLRLVLAGPVSFAERELRSTAPQSLHHEDLVFVSYLSDGAMRELYSSAEALVYPSLYEGFGMPVLEAMACGTRVVTSRGSSLPEVAGDAAVLVEPTDVDAIAAGLQLVLSESTSDANGRRARGIAWSRNFSWQSAGRSVLKIYDEIAR